MRQILRAPFLSMADLVNLKHSCIILYLRHKKRHLQKLNPAAAYSKANQLAMTVLTQGLLDLGILQGELQELLDNQACKAFYMHGLGHWLGLDVHDVGDYKQDEKERPFVPGMVLTIEPGLYIALDAKAPEQYKGIGIRIEDNLLVTEQGHENLTASVPKSISEIEAVINMGKC